jgi:hypothetical protein
MTALHGFFGLPILKDITTQEWDARIDSPSCYGGMTGSSSGAVAALALLQATSDCVFQRGVSKSTSRPHGHTAFSASGGIGALRETVCPLLSERLVCGMPGCVDGRDEPQWKDVACGWAR